MTIKQTSKSRIRGKVAMKKNRFLKRLIKAFNRIHIGHIIIISTIIVTIAVISCGCGNTEPIQINKCTDIYTQAFCDSIRGDTGQSGRDGESIVGPEGERGADGESITGPQGIQGERGESGTDGVGCTVTQLDNGALVLCGEDSSAIIYNGLDGKDGADSIIEVIYPCGEQKFSEALFRLSDDYIYAVYASGQKIHLTRLIEGEYQTTDGFKCNFKIDSENSVSW